MRTRVLVFFALLALPASTAHAQGATSDRLDARWSAWVGCWTPGAARDADRNARVCIVPAPEGSGVQMISFDGARELLNERFIGDGTPQRLADGTCTGERTSTWAAAGPRLFSASTVSCPDQPAVKTSRISTLVTADQWIDVQVVTSGDRTQVRTRRFWRSSDTPPEQVVDALRQTTPARPVLTVINIDDVIEASRMLPSIGVEAWLAESGARVGIDRRALVRLADARVSTTVIDLMVALAYPKKFEVRRQQAGGGGFLGGSFGDGFYPGEWGYLADALGYGFGFGYPYWLGTNGYYYPGGIYLQPGGGGGGAADDGAHGQVVNGLGYTRVQPRVASRGTGAGGAASAASTGGSGSSGGGSSNGGSSSGGSSGGATSSGYSGGGGSTSTGLTAVPR